jgi:hypothetical protein
MHIDPNGNSFVLITFLIIVGVSTVLSAVDGGISAAMMGQDFWLGFTAGAIGGFVGGTIGYFIGSPLLGRAINSTIYGITNELFQKGNLKEMDWAMLAFDATLDVALSNGYSGYIDNIGKSVLKNSTQALVSSLVMGLSDGIIDVAQTGFLYKPYTDLMIKLNNQTSNIQINNRRFLYEKRLSF